MTRLGDLTPRQWKSGIAAWLGWLFDGLDMHLYTLVATPFVAQLLLVRDPKDPAVGFYSSLIQAAFLVGWALGGGFFGRTGRPAGPRPGLDADDPHLRLVHRPGISRPDLVAVVDLPLPGRTGHRRRMGGGRGLALRDLAQDVAALDRRRAANRRQPGRRCWPWSPSGCCR